ncbi:GxGYxY sequence motif-containing protein [Clostridium collagenovorans DSM 3089]|uniref:GxGYxY sequence motif-containing protein n=1 Tax=Clostridium collagenovorans DSM 3089 TaxID=1121306 RepID=A0A1M5VBE8_9CLOT|nr:GxGYxYP domain-containing protein [Clostridium collagenovorans]SHH72569.1 GxGYxY sequence motif-containing protein [Clostridium collagenovorans DSM 3089]
MKSFKKQFFILSLIIIYIFSFTPCFADSFYDHATNNINATSSNPDSNNGYIKNSIIPKRLYVISEKDMTKAEQVMIATLQGIISNKSKKQIYILPSNEPDYEVWLKDLKYHHKIKYEIITNPWKLLKKFRGDIKGYILYDTGNPCSINNACSLAGLNDAIVIEGSIEDTVKSHGITNLIKDCKFTDKSWAYDTLWNSGLNHSTVIELSPDKTTPLRDYALLSKSLVFYENEVNNHDLRDKIFSSMNENGVVLGWGPDEHENVSLCSKYGVDMVAADWSYNLSTLSAFPSTPQKQQTSPSIKDEDGYHYITFIMSDGDNQQWLLGSNYNNKNWFGSPYRGKFNLGWSLNPSLYYLAPTVFERYYKSPISRDFTDNFVVAPSGNGYMYPSKFPFSKLDSYTKRLNNYMEKVDQKYVLILDDESFYDNKLWDKYTCQSNINGLFYLNYYKHNTYNGEIRWSNNKPIVSCRDLLWGGLEDEANLISNINNRINEGHTKLNDPNTYTFVYVHVWSNNMDNINDVINKLNENPKVKITTPDNFMKLIKENLS